MVTVAEILEFLSFGVGLGFLLRIRDFRIEKEQIERSLLDTENTSTKKPPLIVIQNPPTIFGKLRKPKNLEDHKSQIYPSVTLGTTPKLRIFSAKTKPL